MQDNKINNKDTKDALENLPTVIYVDVPVESEGDSKEERLRSSVVSWGVATLVTYLIFFAFLRLFSYDGFPDFFGTLFVLFSPVIFVFAVLLAVFVVKAVRFFSNKEISDEVKERTKRQIWIGVIVAAIVLFLYALQVFCGELSHMHDPYYHITP